MNNKPLLTSPILSLKKDHRMGETETGWALYQTPANEIYIANNDPQNPEYIIPKYNGTISLLKAISDFGDTQKNIIEHLSESILGSESPPEDEIDDDEMDPESDSIPEKIGEAVTILTPATDRVWATGPDTTALISQNGTSYIIHREFCIICTPASLRMAHMLLDKSKPATITPLLSPDGIPSFVITQRNLKLNLEICRQTPDGANPFERN